MKISGLVVKDGRRQEGGAGSIPGEEESHGWLRGVSA